MEAAKGSPSVGLRGIVTNNGLSHAQNEEPMTPKGSILSHPYIQCYILVIIGFHQRVDVPSLKAALQYILNNNSRFSSIVVGIHFLLPLFILETCQVNLKTYQTRINLRRGTDLAHIAIHFWLQKKKGKRGDCRWIREEIDIDKHIIVPDLSHLDIQRIGFVEEYTASLANTPLDSSRPLWEIHVLNAEEQSANAVLKIHHCIGDCVSLMSLLLECSSRINDPQSLPAIQRHLSSPNERNKFPVPRNLKVSAFQAIWNAIFAVWCTLVDMFKAMATLLWMKDNIMPRGSGRRRPQPKRIAHVTVDLEDVAIIRKATNGTVNDVVTGILSAGFVSYLSRRYESSNDEKSTKMHNLRLRALVPVNMRSSPGLHRMEYMMNNPKRARWGNEFGMWILPIPLEKYEDSLQYCRAAMSNSKKKKASFEALCTYFSAKLLSWLMGPNVAMYFLHRLCLNTTLVFSNALGPVEEVQFMGNPISYIVTTVSWLPQPLVVHFQSYAGKGKLAVMATQDLIPDPKQLCMDYMDALNQMKQASLTTLKH